MHAIIAEIETFAQPLMGFVIAHDFKHADRVRKWALQIACAEGYTTLEEVHAAALLHDIGLSKDSSRQHAPIGASLAEAFLHQQGYFTSDQIARIGDAIRHHSSLTGTELLFQILQDADGLEVLGAVGLLRAMSSKWQWEDYPPEHIRGATWGMHADDFTARFANGVGIGHSIMDQINFQISCYEDLHTDTAKRIAMPMVAYMRGFVEQFESEIQQGQRGSV